MHALFIVVALSSGLMATTVGGQSVRYKGTLDTWYSQFGVPYTGAKVVESYWRVRILEDGKAIFFLRFIELNIAEPGQTPGSYDYFIVRMTTDNVVATGDGCVITGTSYWWKNKVETFTLGTVITISETNLPTQFSMDFDGWRITGSLTP